MSRFLKTLCLALVVVGGVWLLLNKDRIHEPSDIVELVQEKLVAMKVGVGQSQAWLQPVRPADDRPVAAVQVQPSATPASVYRSDQFVSGAAIRQPRTSIRIASFMIDGAPAARQQQVAVLIADICRRYDVIAIQGVGRSNAVSAKTIVDRMNVMETRTGSQAGRPQYRYVAGKLGNQSRESSLTIVYDANAVQVDELHAYTVNDPDQVLATPPLVAWFRTRGVSTDQAFTFSLVNLQLDSQRPDRELEYVGELFRAIRDDGRDEDDVIIAGNFNAGDRGLQPIERKAGLTWVVSGTPTNTQRTAQFDNVVFNRASTVEFTGGGGVFDFMKHYNLRLADAVGISSHLPVWAEFSLHEGGRAGNVARLGSESPK